RLKLLKLRFPTSLADAVATFEVPYGHVVRPANGDETPAQAWVDVSGPGAGLAVLNDGKYGHDVRGAAIGVTVARSPVYAWHEPKVVKLAGDGDDLVVRVHEPAGRAGPARVELPLVERTLEVELGAAEIRTFRVPRAPEEPAVETSLLEDCRRSTVSSGSCAA